MNLNVAYIIGTYPGLTTTFIDREVQALRQRGVHLQIVSIRRPWTTLSPEQKKLQKGVRYLLPVNWLAFLWANLWFAVLRPRAYFGTFLYLISRPHPSLKARGMTVLHFAEGVFAAYFLRGENWDHLHAHFIDRAATVALVVSRLLGIPYSLTAHASDIYVNPILLKEKLGGAKFVATCTGYNREYLSQFGEGLYNHKLNCIYHGLELERYRRKPAPSPDKAILLSVGQLKERKGFRYLVGACRELIDRGYPVECHIIGEGPLRADLEEQIRQLSLEGSVLLCGSLLHQEVIEQYQAAAVFVLPAVLGGDGDRDGIPNVILEAMAMELPVVSTNHSGIPEVVQDRATGLLVPPADEAALADAIAKLLDDADLRRRLGRNGRQTVAEKFDVERNVTKLLGEFAARWN
jgi:glycosyltransferase involved in cell wall biosynthesis